MDIVNIKVADIKPYPKNTKKHPAEQISNIAKSIEKYGFIQPIVLDKNNEIVIGHGRILASKKLKMQEVPCVYAENLSDEDIKALRIIDNKLNESEWDPDFLKEELADIDLSDFDLDFDDVLAEDETEEGAEIVEDEVPEVPEEPKAKLGDIYQLGNHRLMCGDSTNEEDVAKLMNGVKADMVFTDPPYGMKKENDGVLNDNLNYDDLLDFNRQWIPLTFGALKDNGSWYCWGIDEPLMDIYSNILKPMQKQNKITFRNFITWKKENDNPTMIFNGACSSNNRSYYTNEKCLFVMAGVQGFNNNSENYYEGFEPIRSYLDAECEKCGGHKIWKQMLGNNMGHHYFTKSQWCFPTKEAYEKMQAFGKEYGAFGKEYEKIKKQYEEIKKEWYDTRAYFDGTKYQCIDVWVNDVTSEKEKESAGGHATPKPIAICTRAIETSSRENENVLDVFGGSGSTLIACEQNNRNAYLMELEPKWVDVIIQRWENFTGKKAELLNGVDA